MRRPLTIGRTRGKFHLRREIGQFDYIDTDEPVDDTQSLAVRNVFGQLYIEIQSHVRQLPANAFGPFGPHPIENRTNKQVRIRRLSPYLSSGRLRFKSGSPDTRLLVEQLKEFPVGDHDDGPDAAEMAVRLAAELLCGRAVKDQLGDRLPVG